MKEVISIIKYQFQHPFLIKGRASRNEYWTVYLFFLIASKLVDILIAVNEYLFYDSKIFFFSVIIFYFLKIVYYILSLLTIWVGIVVGIRRFHDVGKSGFLFIGISVAEILGMIFAGVSLISYKVTGVTSYFYIAVLLGITSLIFVIYFFFILVKRGDIGPNKYGEDPYENKINE